MKSYLFNNYGKATVTSDMGFLNQPDNNLRLNVVIARTKD